MAPELKAADCTQRLADQLQTLSQVAEILTFRLLELEERLTVHEVRLEQLLEGGLASGSPMAEGTELRLVETEDRLARLESLLKEVVVQVPHQEAPHLDEPLAEDGFIAEEEPFLDDQEFERPNFERQEFERPQFGHQRFERHLVERQESELHQLDHEQSFMDELSA